MYYIAYKDSNGNDFNGLPWIEPIVEGDGSAQAAKNRAEVYSNMLTSIVVFECDDKDLPEECISWEFVNNHKIE